jgi:hypothetical protein
MPVTKITLSTAMRARDVSRPREEHLAEAAEREEKVTRHPEAPRPKPAPPQERVAPPPERVAQPQAETRNVETLPAPQPSRRRRRRRS